MPSIAARTLLISAGAVLGANARYWIGVVMARVDVTGIPWWTLLINVSGSLVLGVFLGVAAKRVPDPGWTFIVAVGFCGAYTTFSTFSYEVFTMLQAHAVGQAVGYIAASVGLSLGAAALGWVGGQAIAGA